MYPVFSAVGLVIMGFMLWAVAVAMGVYVVNKFFGPQRWFVWIIYGILLVGGRPFQLLTRALSVSKSNREVDLNEFGELLWHYVVYPGIPMAFWALWAMIKSVYTPEVWNQWFPTLMKLLYPLGILSGVALLIQLVWMFHRSFTAPTDKRRKDRREAYAWNEIKRNLTMHKST